MGQKPTAAAPKLSARGRNRDAGGIYNRNAGGGAAAASRAGGGKTGSRVGGPSSRVGKTGAGGGGMKAADIPASTRRLVDRLAEALARRSDLRSAAEAARVSGKRLLLSPERCSQASALVVSSRLPAQTPLPHPLTCPPPSARAGGPRAAAERPGHDGAGGAARSARGYGRPRGLLGRARSARVARAETAGAPARGRWRWCGCGERLGRRGWRPAARSASCQAARGR